MHATAHNVKQFCRDGLLTCLVVGEVELIFDFLEMNLKYCCPRNAINGLTPWMLAQEKTESDSNEADWLL